MRVIAGLLRRTPQQNNVVELHRRVAARGIAVRMGQPPLSTFFRRKASLQPYKEIINA
jgi:hypothetical protein